jgi:hypothetical protein
MKTTVTTRLLNSVSADRTTISSRALRWIAVDTVLGAASGALFGFVFGAFGLLLDADSWSIISVTGYFALCGTAAGAMVGACGAILEGDGIPDPITLSLQSTHPRTALETSGRELTNTAEQSKRHLPVNRLINVDSRNRQINRNPLRN